MQEKAKDIVVEKVPREQNPSDVLTHAGTGKEGAIHVPSMGMKIFSGFTSMHLLNPRVGVEFSRAFI